MSDVGEISTGYETADWRGPGDVSEVMLVGTVRRWRDQVLDLLPERAADLRRIVDTGQLDGPEWPSRQDGSRITEAI